MMETISPCESIHLHRAEFLTAIPLRTGPCQLNREGRRSPLVHLPRLFPVQCLPQELLRQDRIPSRKRRIHTFS